jgi:hypothetical protein
MLKQKRKGKVRANIELYAICVSVYFKSLITEL